MWVFVHVKKIPVNGTVYGDSEERERAREHSGGWSVLGLAWLGLEEWWDSDRKARAGGKC